MDMQFYAFLLFLWLFSYVFLRSVVLNRCRQGKAYIGGCNTPALPPSPMALPLLGHLYLLGPVAHQSFDALAKRYGPILHLQLASLGSAVVVSSPALVREFLKSHDLTFAFRPSVVAQEYISGDSIGFSFLPYGSRWKLLKKILMTELFSPRKIQKMARIRQEEVKRFLGSLLQKSRAGELADLEDMLAVLTNNIICGMTMSVTGGNMSGASNEYRKVVQEHVELSSKINTVHLLVGGLARLDLLGYGRRLKKANKRFLAMVDRILEEHELKKKRLKQERNTTKGMEEDGERVEEEEDLVDILLKISDDEGAEVKLTRHNIRTCLLVHGFSFSILCDSFISAGVNFDN